MDHNVIVITLSNTTMYFTEHDTRETDDNILFFILNQAFYLLKCKQYKTTEPFLRLSPCLDLKDK